MSTLTEIEAAVETLPAEDQQQLLIFLAARLRKQPSSVPSHRTFSPDQVKSWIAEDDAAMQSFRDRDAK